MWWGMSCCGRCMPLYGNGASRQKPSRLVPISCILTSSLANILYFTFLPTNSVCQYPQLPLHVLLGWFSSIIRTSSTYWGNVCLKWWLGGWWMIALMHVDRMSQHSKVHLIIPTQANWAEMMTGHQWNDQIDEFWTNEATKQVPISPF